MAGARSPVADVLAWVSSSADFQQQVRDAQKGLPPHPGIPLGDIMKADETVPAPEDEVRPQDNYAYQDILPRDFPFHIDTPRVAFIGQLEQKPVWAHFTLTNLSLEPFWFKVKLSNKVWFKLEKSVGKLMPEENVVIPILYYPGLKKRPKSMCHYVEIHALTVDMFDEDPFETWNERTRIREESRKVFFEFMWHPNKARTQAMLNGRLLRENGQLEQFDVEDATVSMRQGLINRLIDLHKQKELHTDVETIPDKTARMKREYENMNNVRLLPGLLDELRQQQPVAMRNIIERHETVEEAIDQAYMAYRKEMKRKGFNVRRLTEQEIADWRARKEKRMERYHR